MIMGFTMILIYTNLLSFGYTIWEYLEFIGTHWECYPFYIGLILYTALLLKK